MTTRKTVHLDIDDETWNQFKGKAAVTGMTVAGLIKSYVVNYAEVGTTGTVSNVRWDNPFPPPRPTVVHIDPTAPDNRDVPDPLEKPDDDRR